MQLLCAWYLILWRVFKWCVATVSQFKTDILCWKYNLYFTTKLQFECRCNQTVRTGDCSCFGTLLMTHISKFAFHEKSGSTAATYRLARTEIFYLQVVNLRISRNSLVKFDGSVAEIYCFSFLRNNPYPTAFPYGNSMVLHFYQQQESSTTKTVHKVINKGLKTYV